MIRSDAIGSRSHLLPFEMIVARNCPVLKPGIAVAGSTKNYRNGCLLSDTQRCDEGRRRDTEFIIRLAAFVSPLR
jgi:hypothetical protein